MDLKDVKLYRMTHIDNIPHILHYGITHKNSPNASLGFVSIGDKTLINNRDLKIVNIQNNDLAKRNTLTIKLGDYIPFYFGVRMPMLYVIQQGGNFVPNAVKPENIVYLACSVLQVAGIGKKWFFSDGHGTDRYTKFYDDSKLPQLPDLIDWKAITEQYWGAGNLDVKRKKQAEFIIEGDVPPELIIGFGCYNNDAKNRLLDMGVLESKIKVIPKAYYANEI